MSSQNILSIVGLNLFKGLGVYCLMRHFFKTNRKYHFLLFLVNLWHWAQINSIITLGKTFGLRHQAIPQGEKTQTVPSSFGRIIPVSTDITGIFLPPICRNMEAIFMLYYIIFILLGDLCEVKFSGRIIVVKSVSSREIKVLPNSRLPQQPDREIKVPPNSRLPQQPAGRRPSTNETPPNLTNWD